MHVCACICMYVRICIGRAGNQAVFVMVCRRRNCVLTDMIEYVKKISIDPYLLDLYSYQMLIFIHKQHELQDHKI